MSLLTYAPTSQLNSKIVARKSADGRLNELQQCILFSYYGDKIMYSISKLPNDLNGIYIYMKIEL